MKKQMLLIIGAACGLLSVMVSLPVRQVDAQGNTSGNTPKDFVPPLVFQAAGPTAASIQSTVDAYRAALGEPNNANTPGPLTSGRREINWDGGGDNFTTQPFPPVTPFDVFLDIRGARFTTLGTGLTQAPPVADPEEFPPGGLAGLFNNPTYGEIFSTFSPERLFTPVGSNITQAVFFVPGTNGGTPATVTGFGAVFTDVDQPDGSGLCKKHGHHEADAVSTDDGDQPETSGFGKKRGDCRGSTFLEYFDADGKLLLSSFVPAPPGDGSLSFFGIVFDDARIARVPITSGNVAPGPDDDRKRGVVVMDDFLYGEPQPLQ